MDVTAAVLRRGSACMVVQKSSGLWEFPGGKREAGETLADCLLREIREELHLRIANPVPLDTVEHPPYRLHFFQAELPGLPTLTEHQQMAMLPPRLLLQLPMSPPDRVMAQRLALNDPPIRRLVWDLDGTLIDTYPQACAALCEVLHSHGVGDSPEEVMARMKTSLGRCFRHYAPLLGMAPGTLRAAYQEAMAPREPSLSPLPGIPEALEALSQMGCTHYLWTHRDGGAWDLLAQNGLDHYFAGGVTADDGFPAKPDPAGLLSLMAHHGLAPEETMMIGDRLIDVQGGRLAGVMTLLLKDGYADSAHPSVELALSHPSDLVARMQPLPC